MVKTIIVVAVISALTLRVMTVSVAIAAAIASLVFTLAAAFWLQRAVSAWREQEKWVSTLKTVVWPNGKG